jgi:2-dehydropantoate 2-reductase
MRILVFGAGAIGGYLGAILTAAGRDVTLVARGAQYEALARRGVILESPKRSRDPIPVRVCRPGEEQGPYDLVIVSLKSHQIADAAEHLARLAASGGSLLCPQNGIPWWYFEKLDSPLRGSRLPSLDPDGCIARAIPVEAVVGAVIYKPTDHPEPGRIVLADQPTERLVIGELDGKPRPRLEAIKAVIEAAGLNVAITDNIRAFKWQKLLSNGVFNLLCTVTQSSPQQVVNFPATQQVARAMLEEFLAVAAAVGVVPEARADDVITYTRNRAGFPPSTLQDLRAGRELELDALDNAVLDIARLTGVPAPTLETVVACANLVNRRIIEDNVAFAPAPVRKAG